MKKMNDELKRFVREEEGTEVVEWALVAGLIVVIAAATFALVGGEVNRILGLVLAKLQGVTG